MKILIADKLAQEGLEILTAVDQFQVDCQCDLTSEQLKDIIKDYDALIVRSMTQVTAEIIRAADRLKCIGRVGVGLDNIDMDAATQQSICIVNTPGGNTIATAEHTMSLILSLSRNIPQSHISVRAGQWERSKFKGVELYHKTIGIIGLGRIGALVANMCSAFGMKVIGYDPYLSTEDAKKNGVRMVDFQDLLKESDFITLHLPKTAETVDLITAKEFALMKPSARLINCARGGIVNEKDLVAALQGHQIAGAAIDVYEQEPPDPKHPLFQCDQCVTTPHLGAATLEAQVNVAVEVAESVRDVLLGKLKTCS